MPPTINCISFREVCPRRKDKPSTLDQREPKKHVQTRSPERVEWFRSGAVNEKTLRLVFPDRAPTWRDGMGKTPPPGELRYNKYCWGMKSPMRTVSDYQRYSTRNLNDPDRPSAVAFVLEVNEEEGRRLYRPFYAGGTVAAKMFEQALIRLKAMLQERKNAYRPRQAITPLLHFWFVRHRYRASKARIVESSNQFITRKLMDRVTETLKKAAAPGFWGQVQIDYRGGKPAVVRLIETINIKADEDKRNEKTYRYGL